MRDPDIFCVLSAGDLRILCGLLLSPTMKNRPFLYSFRSYKNPAVSLYGGIFV